jgi:GNAT superfamily N-acetyltransferase
VPAARAGAAKIVCRPLTPARWSDLARLFGRNGACSGCWCMFFRQTGREFGVSHGEANRAAFRRIVRAGRPTGVMAYLEGEPVGWCAIAPRNDYPRLARSRILEPVDRRPAWAVTCFFIKTGYRGRGLNAALLEGAVRFAARRGARLIEGYPIDPKRPISNMEGFHGLVSTFRGAGFREVARRSPIRPIMRFEPGGAKVKPARPSRARPPRPARGRTHRPSERSRPGKRPRRA